ncbi:ComF family protein [Streptomyces sp. NPDC000851]
MRGWWQDLSDLVLPAECGGCGRPRTVLCPECRAALSGAAPRRVRPAPEPPGLPVVYAAARYADEVRAVLLAHKERGALTLAGPLGVALAGAVRTGLRDAREGRTAVGGAASGRAGGAAGSAGMRRGAVDGTVLLVPVPSGRGAVRKRGHDPARRIALAAAAELRQTGTPTRVLAVLRQRRAVADQSELTSRQRLENLAGALQVAAGGAGLLGGGPVVLVDDLMTTGSSLAEAARAMRAAVADRAVAHGGVASVVRADVEKAVYGRGNRERAGKQMTGSMDGSTGLGRVVPGMAGPTGAGEVICAAVVAATPDSFEMNRN